MRTVVAVFAVVVVVVHRRSPGLEVETSVCTTPGDTCVSRGRDVAADPSRKRLRRLGRSQRREVVTARRSEDLPRRSLPTSTAESPEYIQVIHTVLVIALSV